MMYLRNSNLICITCNLYLRIMFGFMRGCNNFNHAHTIFFYKLNCNNINCDSLLPLTNYVLDWFFNICILFGFKVEECNVIILILLYV